MKKTLFAAAAVMAASVAGACYPHRLDSVDYDVVATVYDTAATFQANTYYLRPQVVHLVPPGGVDNIGAALDPVILSTIRSNMNAAGYTEAFDSLSVDVKVMAAATTTEYSGFYWDYWCTGWYYYCPPYWNYYEFTVGSLIVTLKDRRAAGTGPEAMWLGIGNGLLGTGAAATRVTDAINAMFRQSPYISAN